MNAAAQNPLNAPVFEIPNPPDEFGQDGGKFYRCYDALAQEIDDDMTSGLKEQLEGMLIFAGLFAGVNTAFLALTIPLLSADPADDTNALLAQNNAILMQLVMGRNESVLVDSPLPSTAFAPSHDIFIINALFALSLTFAIISSFLAVLGRQWLVYYRKRGGGGPDRQRWEQLKRFLGAERWRLEAILDDVLPSLLQVGLIIFCISLILYLRHLSPAISLIVAIPLYVGLAFFVGSALCIMWDRFCPFHSPLSHLLLWTAHSLSRAGMITKSIPFFFWTVRDGISGLIRRVRDGIPSFIRRVRDGIPSPIQRVRRVIPFLSPRVPFLHGIPSKREEESLQSLQVIALQRAICISDDPATLLHATANIFAIQSPVEMKQLWDEPPFRQRFLDLLRNSKNGIVQLRGYNVDSKDISVFIRSLYGSAAAHIALTLDSRWSHCDDLLTYIRTTDATTICIPAPLLRNSASTLIKANMGIFTLGSLFHNFSGSELETVCSHLTACYEALASYSDLRFLSFSSWVISRFPDDSWVDLGSLEQMRQPYRGNAIDAMEPIRQAFMTLLSSKSVGSGDLFPRDTCLTNMLRCLERIVAEEQANSDVSIGHKFKLLEICEAFLRNPRLPEAAGQVGRKLRVNIARIWSREFINLANHYRPTDNLVGPLQSYIANLRNLDRSEFGYHEDIAVAQVSGPMLRESLSHYTAWQDRELESICEMFNTFVSDVHKASRQLQNNSRRVRDPDERWCHWQEEPLSIKPVRTQLDTPLLLLSSPAAPEDHSVS